MAQEIQIHRELWYKHVVGFHSYFEDTHYVYIILELCRKRVCVNSLIWSVVKIKSVEINI